MVRSRRAIQGVCQLRKSRVMPAILPMLLVPEIWFLLGYAALLIGIVLKLFKLLS